MAHLTKERVKQLYSTFGELKVLDDIIRYRAADATQVPILGYPKNDNDLTDYEKFTGQQLDLFIDGAVNYFIAQGLKPGAREVVGIFAQSDVDYVVSFFALSRLGCTILCLSLRLAPVAIIDLLKQTNCRIVVHGDSPQIVENLISVEQERPLTKISIPARSQYSAPRTNNATSFSRQVDRDSETHEVALIMHSSGSTGLPKPISLTHQALLTHPLQGAEMNNFAVLPLYHIYGLSTTLQAMYMRKTANLFSARLPITTENLLVATEVVKPEVIHVVPYSLGLLAEQDRGMEILKSAKMVTAAGARTPDELGDRLVKENVRVGVVFGSTEAGLLGDTMRREENDDSWNYVRIYANVREHILMDPIGDNEFEAVYLRSHPGLFKSTSNEDWRSRDVFIPHPTIPDVWKYVTRLDDRVTLSNGEKVLPLPIEGCIRENELVREAVVVGIDRALPGVLLFRAQSADNLSDDEYLDAVWPTIVDANSRAEGFSQISRYMVAVIPSNVSYPKTDKGGIIRARVYRDFADTIDELYEKLDDGREGTLKLSLPDLEVFLKKTYEDLMDTSISSVDADFFNAGIDSLNAIQMRRIIQKTLYLGGHRLSNNVIYEQGNIKLLANHLYRLAQGLGSEEEDGITVMRKLIDKYSAFGEVAILTGATGSIGAHTLAQMVAKRHIRKVYCFVRGADPMGRVLESLKLRGLKLSSPEKVVAISANFSLEDFGLGEALIEQFKNEVSLIVHLAWPVNFNIHLQSFEPQLAGLNWLLALSLTVRRPEPARLYFASSVSTAENTPAPATILEAPIVDFNQATPMGYAQSKLVAEYMIINAARAGARSYVLRIGQVVGDLENGQWNDAEFVPSMFRSVLSLKALPILNEMVSWLPVDTLARAFLEIDDTLRSSPRPHVIDRVNPPVFYNMVNPDTFSWDRLLQALKEAGLDFEAVSFADWLQLLRDDAARGNEKYNPAVKLLGYFEDRYKSNLGDEPNGTNGTNGSESGGISWDTRILQRDSGTMRTPPKIIEDGYVKKFISKWLPVWTRTAS
ncbi:acetyl-CoA synthetase-like protein [Xylaria sp. FL1777]|nr:acetyl-CoA synthetase-like protein [Xylaria sp. FL1777]